MSKTLVRGLALIEEVGLYGPLTVSELARRADLHVSIVSRTIAALEPEGWLIRVDGKVAAGPRCALLGLISPAGQTVRRADPLARAIAAVTGVSTAASGLTGRDVMIPAASPAGVSELPEGFSSRVPVYVMAAGRAIAAQVPDETLDAILPPDPFPDGEEVVASLAGSAPVSTFIATVDQSDDPPASIPLTRAALDTEIETIRATGFARDAGELHPAVHCIAAPWPTPELPASFACIGSQEEIAAKAELIERCLHAAVRPGAGPQEIFDVVARAPAGEPEGG